MRGNGAWAGYAVSEPTGSAIEHHARRDFDQLVGASPRDHRQATGIRGLRRVR